MLLTETPSPYNNLEAFSASELLTFINAEDQTVAQAVNRALSQITALTEALVPRFRAGGRLIYVGAGTSGRIGITDASECPPTFGTAPDRVVGLIAGGTAAVFKAQEFAEDNIAQAQIDLQNLNLQADDSVIGLSASGTTPYVKEALLFAKKNGLLTGAVVCNPDSSIAETADFPIEVITGPEFLTGSTRMKAGTAQKMVLNMISTSVMILTGKVKDNYMADMMLTNEKLITRGTRIVARERNLTEEQAKELLLRAGSVRKALETEF